MYADANDADMVATCAVQLDRGTQAGRSSSEAAR
jgi:hypothetical protein